MLWTANQILGVNFASQAAFDAHCAKFLMDRRGGLQVTNRAGTIDLHASEGRWCGDCPNCKGGMAGPSPTWGTHSTCLTCGSRYAVRYPANRTTGEAILERRPMKNQNWHPLTETTQKLQNENTLMGV